MDEIEKSYIPKRYEKKWYAYWEKNGLFTPKGDFIKEPFSIVLPLPILRERSIWAMR